jgi:UDP-N-acetylmuramoyl-tripeptide--D-alanyl-D-alanine ligase
MLRKVKNTLYFFVARYFRFWAAIQLGLWRPRVVVVTGSNGKTTTLHLLESQLQSAARYSHFANSAFGIPFDILGLGRTSFSRVEWVRLFVLAPIRAFKKPFKEDVYAVEADCDRPGEGRFLATLLKPETIIWLSSARTHSQNFDKLVQKKAFPSVDEAIAYEFGWFAQCASKLVVYNSDNPLLAKQVSRATARCLAVSKQEGLDAYTVSLEGTEFGIHGARYPLPFLLPEETFYSIAASLAVCEQLGLRPDPSFKKLSLPPGRSSLFKGLKDTTIVDSTYNANLASVSAILSMLEELKAEKKWLVLGDLIEQGQEEREEHEQLAALVAKSSFERIILVGPRLAQYAYPLLQKMVPAGKTVVSFVETKEALEYVLSSIAGGEVVVLKGARFLEGIVEHLLANKEDAAKLCRREDRFQLKRKAWAL